MSDKCTCLPLVRDKTRLCTSDYAMSWPRDGHVKIIHPLNGERQ